MFLMLQLNPLQQQAIEYTEGPLLLLAGAGSGKTRVLTARMTHLIQSGLARPWNIFAVTFTNKAAGEMKERIEKLLGVEARSMMVSTFHSACLRILRKNAETIGFSPNFVIYDDRDQLGIIESCLEDLKINPQILAPKTVAHRINQLKNEGITADMFLKHDLDFFAERVAQVYQLYEKKMKVNQAFDFGDLILKTLYLFIDKPEILHQYRSQYKYIHVDEYQDTNRCQYLLIKMLADGHGNLCVVGDDDQSIYKFRGAEIRNILDFQKDYPETRIIRLEQNYRSTKNILKAASSVIANNNARMGKTLWTENDEGEKITLYKGQTDENEAKFVINQIKRLGARYSYSQMAIFYRTNAQSRSFEDELRRNRIPYQIVGGMRFYDRQEIKDMLAYLKLLANPHDSVSIKRVINVPARAIGKTTVEKIEAIATEKGISLWDVLTTPELIGGSILMKVRPFVDLIDELKKAKEEKSLVELVSYVYEKTGYWQMLKNERNIEAESRLENLEELVNVFEEYTKREENPTLEGFLDQAALVSDLDKMENAEEKITLMTFHLAKGLEFPIVFMVGMEEGFFPHSRSVDSEDEVEEERRLCYVGMTRAMEKLFLSFVQTRRIFGNSQFRIASRFLEEIPEDVVDVEDELESYSRSSSRSSSFDEDVRVDYSYDQRNEYEESSNLTKAGITSSSRSFKYKQGTKVRHPQFGLGIIKTCEGSSGDEKLTISFAVGGIKKLLAKYANLEVV